MTAIEFAVAGTPVGQGSKSAVVRGGRAVVIEGKTSGQRALHASWRNAVAATAMRHMAGRAPLDGPLHVTLRFRVAMPASRPKRTRDLGVCWRVGTPDLDKLVRSTLDALTAGGVLVDDRLVCDLDASKVEVTGWTGVAIYVETIDDSPVEREALA